MKADLHSHTFYSDGLFDVKYVMDLAKEKGLTHLSITDHDCVKEVPEAIEYGKQIGLTIIPGVEFSTHLRNRSVHILGYFKNEIPENVQEYFADMLERRRERCRMMCERIVNIYGLDMDLERLMKIPGNLTRAHMSRELIMSNPGLTTDGTRILLSENTEAFIPSSKITPHEAIEFLHEAGALVIVAHPTLYPQDIIDDVLKEDIDGIECYYPTYITQPKEYFLDICQKRNLIVTAGSDFHGDKKDAGNKRDKHGMIGDCYIEGEVLEKFLERIKSLK